MMRFKSIVSEAWRNVMTGTAHTVALVLILGALSTAIVAADSYTVQNLEAQALTYRTSGGSTQIMEAPGAIDPALCENLSTSPDGLRAGGIRAAPANIVTPTLPGSSLPTFEVSLGYSELILDSRKPLLRGGVLVSEELAQALGLKETDSLKTTMGDTQVAGIFRYPDDGRRQGLGYAVLVPVISDEPFDQCWAEVWPPSGQVINLLRSTLIPSAQTRTEQPKIGQLNSSLGREFDGTQLFNERITKYLPLGLLAVSFFVVFVSLRARRLELASARHSGVGPYEQWVLTMMESLGWVVCVWAFTLAVACVAAIRAAEGDTLTFLLIGLPAPALTCIGGLLGASAAVLMSHERHLFHHFKNRQ